MNFDFISNLIARCIMIAMLSNLKPKHITWGTRLQISTFKLETQNNRKGILKTVRKLFALSFELKQNLSRPTFWQETKPKYRTTLAFTKAWMSPIRFFLHKICRLMTYFWGCFLQKTCDIMQDVFLEKYKCLKKIRSRTPCDVINQTSPSELSQLAGKEWIFYEAN